MWHSYCFIGGNYATSNVTTVIEVRSASTLVCRYVVPPGECYYNILLCCHFLIVECRIACFLCAMRVSEVRASSSPLGYLCAKFRFSGNLHCCASPWRKTAYSITYSLTHLIWCAGNQSFCFRKTSKVVHPLSHTRLTNVGLWADPGFSAVTRETGMTKPMT